MIFGSGLALFIGQSVEGKPRGTQVRPIEIPLLHDIPIIGRVLFDQDVLVYATFALTGLVAFYLFRTRPGLALRSVGESPATADAVGISVSRIRYSHVLIGGLFAGAGGAYQMLVRVPSWNQARTTNGIGWIALALVVFSAWRPARALLGAIIFGFALRCELHAPGRRDHRGPGRDPVDAAVRVDDRHAHRTVDRGAAPPHRRARRARYSLRTRRTLNIQSSASICSRAAMSVLLLRVAEVGIAMDEHVLVGGIEPSLDRCGRLRRAWP